MLAQLAIGGTLIFLTVAIQSAFVGALVIALIRVDLPRHPHGSMIRTAVTVGGATLWLMAAHTIAVWLWAVAFLGLGVFGDLETSIYFSGVAFTTLGFGDIIPPLEWRQLAGLCAANGLLAFGVSTAALVEVIRRFWTPDGGGPSGA